MFEEGLITKEQAVCKVEPDHLSQLLHPQFARSPADYSKLMITTGLPASPGAAVGQIVFTAKAAE
eukprot:577296-Pyramimonas_sp.AAC.2